MTVPVAYERASRDFYQFLCDARDIAGVETTHRAFTMVEGVLLTFRRRLTVQEGLRFANVLPLLVRALFASHWNATAATMPFESREAMTQEAQSLRSEHNFAPHSAIRDVAEALRKNMDEAELDEVLSTLSSEAQAFWRV